MQNTEVVPAKLPDTVAKKFTLHVTQAVHYFPSLGREVDVTKIDVATAKLIAEKHPKIISAIATEPEPPPKAPAK